MSLSGADERSPNGHVTRAEQSLSRLPPRLCRRRCARRPFEGYWDHQLPRRAALLREFAEVEGYPRGQYTDDTQLTLATVESIVRRRGLEPADVARSIASLWKHDSVIGPGGACTRTATTFLKTRDWTTCGAPVGQAGNGTAMRTAVLGLFFLYDPDSLPESVADISRITHRDPRSVAGGVAIAKAAQLLASREPPEAAPFCECDCRRDATLRGDLREPGRGATARLSEDRQTALHAIAWAGSPRPEFSRPVITPFVVPTVLAALWSLLKTPFSWEDAVAEAIGLGGDVDTLGAIVGALAGARLGVTAIPSHLATGVLGSERIKILASQYQDVVTGRRIRSEP